ncbi:hypothetical protein GCM10009834_08460 [Streptomonospora arabica]
MCGVLSYSSRFPGWHAGPHGDETAENRTLGPSGLHPAGFVALGDAADLPKRGANRAIRRKSSRVKACCGVPEGRGVHQGSLVARQTEAPLPNARFVAPVWPTSRDRPPRRTGGFRTGAGGNI